MLPLDSFVILLANKGLCQQVEAELVELDEEEAAEYLASLGASEGGLRSLIRATYKQLGLLTYFTTGQYRNELAGYLPMSASLHKQKPSWFTLAGEKETRAWTITAGNLAPQAAGVIHSDFEKGFIRAETVAYKDFAANHGLQGCKEKGLLRLEGKEYVVQEGDILNFRFSN